MKNLRAAGQAEMIFKGRSLHITASEVPVDERPPILDIYRTELGRAVASHSSRPAGSG